MDDNFMGEQLEKLLGDAGKMREKMEEAKEQIANLQVIGSAGGGMVRITANGERRVLRVSISDECMNDRDMLQDLVAAAANDAIKKLESAIGEKMKSSFLGPLGGILG